MNVAKDKMTIIAGGKDDGPKKGGGKGGGGGGWADKDDWRNALVRTKEGHPKAVSHNVMLILHHDVALADLFWLDEFANKIKLSRNPPWNGGNHYEFTEVDGLELSAWLGSPERYTLGVGVELVMQCVEAIARRKKRHVAREYLQGLVWDGVPRVERMFVDLYGSQDNDYTHGCAKCFMVGAVSRILWVDLKQHFLGSKVDFMLVLEGGQGAGKTTSLISLFSAEWNAEATESPAAKDFYQILQGHWSLEIGEMDSFTKADTSKVKQAITVRYDTYRPSYGRSPRSFRRETIFVGTTNKSDYLRDETGARRFLPLIVGSHIKNDEIVKQRDQLWAEAVTMYEAKFPYWVLPEGAKREQDARYSDDVWTERVVNWLAGKAPAAHYEHITAENRDLLGRVSECSTADLLGDCLRVEVARHDKQGQMRVGAIMRRLGWPDYRPTKFGERVRCYYRPDEVPDA